MNNAIKEILKEQILSTESRMEQVFEEIQKKPENIENDEVLLMLMDHFADCLGKY